MASNEAIHRNRSAQATTYSHLDEAPAELEGVLVNHAVPRFMSFVFTSLQEMKQLGFGLAVAVLLDAFVIRMLLLPSAMVLLGRASWWPSALSRQDDSVEHRSKANSDQTSG